MMATSSARIIGSVLVPKDHVEFVDVTGARIAYVELKPAYRIISGDPLDNRICTAKINMDEMLAFIKSQVHAEFLELWRPTGKPN